MKPFSVAIFLLTLNAISFTAQSQGVFDKIKKAKDKISQHNDTKNNQQPAADTTLQSNGTTNSSSNTTTTATKGDAIATPSFKVYQNYDFVPGDKILFEDNFISDQDGEFPAHWELVQGPRGCE